MSDDEDNIPVLDKNVSEETIKNTSSDETNTDAVENNEMDVQNVSEECKNKFSNYMTQFIDALCNVFPEDIQLGLVKTKLSLAIGKSFTGDTETREERKKKMIEKWHQVMHTHYSDILAKKPTFIPKLIPSDFNGINLQAKFSDPTIDSDTRDCMLEYCKD